MNRNTHEEALGAGVVQPDKVQSEHYRSGHKKGLALEDNKRRVVQWDLDRDPRRAGVVSAVVDCDPSWSCKRREVVWWGSWTKWKEILKKREI